MKPNARKNLKLIQQFPFIKDILKTGMFPRGPDKDTRRIDDLTIKVQKADGELMHRRGQVCGIGDDNSCSFSMHEKRRNQVLRYAEYALAVGEDGTLLERMSWLDNVDRERSGRPERYCREVLWSGRSGNLLSNPIHKQTAFIVWARVEAWHEDTRADDLGKRYGAFLERSVELTVYGRPDEGFDELDRNVNVYEHLRLDANLMMNGMSRKDNDLMTINGMLYELCVHFQDNVFFKGMKDVIDRGSVRGASGQFGPVKVLCGELCGYDRVMLEQGSDYVTFQLRPGSKQMYVLGQQGTLPRIRQMVRTVCERWNANAEERAAFKADGDVRVL